MVKDLIPGPFDDWPFDLTNVNGTLFFVTEASYTAELWKSDGTAAGTVLVKGFPLSEDGVPPNTLTSVNGALFFVATDGTHGMELWKSDGTTAGTVLVADIQAGDNDSYPFDLTNVGGTLYFTADDSLHGRELWKSNGGAAGTTMLMDIFPGSEYGYTGWYSPRYLTSANGKLFFTANDGAHGTELWALDPAAGSTIYDNPNLAGPWTRNGQQLAYIQQNGLTLTFTDETGHVSTGAFTDFQTISGLDGMTGAIDTALSDDGRIVWTNGQATFTWLRVSLGGQYYNPSNGGLTSVTQDGTQLVFTNRMGGTSSGTLLSPTTVTITDWNQTATFVDGSLQFFNGSSWTKLDLSEEYRNVSQDRVRVIQNGTNLTFVNKVGQTSDGNWISPTQVRATAWNVTGTISNGRIDWSNNSVWNRNLTVIGSSSGQGRVSILATHQLILLTNRSGGTSTARITAPDTIVAVDWGGVVGTLAGGKILWSNNTVWDTFNCNALDAIFGDITTFPFL
jgi:ELWxxDGT repeat protein